MIARLIKFLIIATAVATVATIVGAPLSRTYVVSDDSWATEFSIFFLALDFMLVPALCYHLMYSDPYES